MKRDFRPLPRLEINRKSVDELEFEDFKLVGYDPHPVIRFPVAV
jgi:thymidylate synthase